MYFEPLDEVEIGLFFEKKVYSLRLYVSSMEIERMNTRFFLFFLCCWVLLGMVASTVYAQPNTLISTKKPTVTTSTSTPKKSKRAPIQKAKPDPRDNKRSQKGRRDLRKDKRSFRDDREEDRLRYRRYRRSRRDRYFDRYEYRRYQRYRRYMRRRYRHRRKQKGPRWRHRRFYWSTELGYSMFHYSNYQKGVEQPVHIDSGVLTGRWGYAAGWFIFTGDFSYGFGSVDKVSEVAMFIHLGMTLEILPYPWLSIGLGTGLQMLSPTGSSFSSPAITTPIEPSVTIRLPFKRLALGLRIHGSMAFGDTGFSFGIRTAVVLSQL